MKYTATVEQFATQSPSYIQTIEFDALNDDALELLLDQYAQFGQGTGIKVDDSKRPKRFYESGGFASYLISFVDETGRDLSHLDQGVFG